MCIYGVKSSKHKKLYAHYFESSDEVGGAVVVWIAVCLSLECMSLCHLYTGKGDAASKGSIRNKKGENSDWPPNRNLDHGRSEAPAS